MGGTFHGDSPLHKELQTTNHCWERKISLSRYNPPYSLFSAQQLALKPYTHKQQMGLLGYIHTHI